VELYYHAPNTYFHLFICGLFNNAVSVLEDIASIGRMIVNNELERMWKETIMTYFVIYYPSICLEGVKKPAKSCQDSCVSPPKRLLPEPTCTVPSWRGAQRRDNITTLCYESAGYEEMPCSPVEVHRRCRGTYCFHLQGSRRVK
jgi:hypothetical protein